MASLKENLVSTFDRILDAFHQLKVAQDSQKKSWLNIVAMSSTVPTYVGVSTLPVVGKVYKYTYASIEYYRLVPDTYTIAGDVMYLNYTATTCSTPIATRQQ